MRVTTSQRQLGTALLGYAVAVIAIIALVPFAFALPAGWRLTGFTTVSDLVENVALFVPLGFFAAFAGRRGWVTGLLLSATVELLQQFLPGRFPSLIDVATNTLGAALGALAFWRTDRALTGAFRAAGIAALDLPVMGLVYLSVPMLWLSGLADGGVPRLLPAVTVGATVAVVLASIGRHHLGPRGVPRLVVAALAAAVVGIGLVPGRADDPVIVVVGGALAGLVTLVLLAYPPVDHGGGRRFELPTVRRALVPLAGFLVVSAVGPFPQFGAGWTASAGLGLAAGGAGRLAILRLVELVTVVGVIGYALAEWRGRRPATGAPAGSDWTVSLGVALGVVVVRGFHPAYGASGIELVLLLVSGVAGAGLYRRQRDFVRELLAGPGTVHGAAAGLPKWRYTTEAGADPLASVTE